MTLVVLYHLSRQWLWNRLNTGSDSSILYDRQLSVFEQLLLQQFQTIS